MKYHAEIDGYRVQWRVIIYVTKQAEPLPDSSRQAGTNPDLDEDDAERAMRASWLAAGFKPAPELQGEALDNFSHELREMVERYNNLALRCGSCSEGYGNFAALDRKPSRGV